MFLANPMQANATTASIKEITNQAGAGASVFLRSDLSEQEYIEVAKAAEGTFWGYTNLGIADVDKNLNIRETPSESGKLVGKLPKNAACEVIETADNWAKIISGEVEGYVSTEYLLTGANAQAKAQTIVSPMVIVNVDGLKVRMEPNTESEVMTIVPLNSELEYVETLENGWYEILIDDETAYVSGEYSSLEEKLGTAVTMTELLYGQGVTDIRVDLCEFAKQYIGNPYVWGGTSLTKGADCSGFVLSVFKNFGMTLSHSSRAQINEGTKISVSDAKPGDLIFYGNGSGTINHVAIYIGGGQVVHASSPTTGIRISKYNYRSPVGATRIIND